MFSRTELLLGSEKLGKLLGKTVFVAGLGGVGGYAAECVVRAGVGKLILADCDVVDVSNLNRQILSKQSNIGEFKADVAKKRFLDINPNCQIELLTDFLDENSGSDIFSKYKIDFFLDCIDTISTKTSLIMSAQEFQIPFISSMGAGNCIDVSKVQLGNFSQIEVCPLSREVRRRLRKAGADLNFPSVFTTEQRLKTTEQGNLKKTVNGTISYMPAIFGVLAAGFAIRYLIDN